MRNEKQNNPVFFLYQEENNTQGMWRVSQLGNNGFSPNSGIKKQLFKIQKPYALIISSC